MRFLIVLTGCALMSVTSMGGASAGGEDGQQVSTDISPVRRLVEENNDDRDEDLQQTIYEVRLSFLERETERLEKCFAEKKVFISLRSRAGEAGYYTRSQLHFIFDKVFRDLQTRSFKYSPRDITLSKDGRAFFRSEWTYMVLGSDDVVTEHLHFSFEKDKGSWQIYELKAVSK